MPVIVGTILSHENLKRVEGGSGKLTKCDLITISILYSHKFGRFAEPWHETKREEYINISGEVTPWPDSMIVELGP